MTLRDATPDDLDGIMAIENSSFPTDAWSSEAMADELASPHGRYLVDDHDGVVMLVKESLPGGADPHEAFPLAITPAAPPRAC